ncbi:MAG: metalloregulator ArsR/SmtB family transcription factor [Saprospiraceae bacterium]|nr:metalloregulator ArsR/SmtB family transcription factor [Saprospiraceae bacterium]
MEKRTFKDSIYTAIAGLAKAFGNANRLEILDLLANGEKTVEQVATQTAITVANASQHLQLLKNARLVKSRREGNFIFYTINGKQAYTAWKALRELALAAEPAVQVTLRQYRHEAGSPESLTLDSLPGNDRALLLDVRPTDEYASGSLPGAVSIPIGELPQRLGELPRHLTIITYCRGPFCTFADDAVQLLKANGFDAVRLEETYLDHRLHNDESWKN